MQPGDPMCFLLTDNKRKYAFLLLFNMFLEIGRSVLARLLKLAGNYKHPSINSFYEILQLGCSRFKLLD